MREGRWYPTCITLPDGRALVLSGHTGGSSEHENTSIEFFRPETNTWEPKAPEPRLVTSPPLEETGTYTLVAGLFSKTLHPMVWVANYQIALNSRVARSDTIPLCSTSSSFSFTCSSPHFVLQGRVASGLSLPNLRWYDINC